MRSQVITYEATEDEIQKLDEIASNLDLDRAAVLRRAIDQLVADFEGLDSDIDQARRQIDAGHYTLHEDVVKQFHSKYSKTHAA
jgi:predicted transcriptional regulator